ncbi:14818_t:CDS:2, partial [Racocetra fulgida]
VKTTNEDGNEDVCNQEYELSTGMGNLKSHLRQIHRILPPETNNKNNQIINVASNQSSLHDFLNKKTPLSSSKQDKITNRILAWIVDDLQSFYATTNNYFRDMILECEPRFMFPYIDQLKEKLMQSVLFAEQQLKNLLQTTMDSFCFTTDLWSQFHQPYIAVTIHWIGPEFTLYQALLTIQKFDYPHTASTDNASLMTKAMKQLDVEHIAYSIQLALGDGFNIKEDKYQAELNPQHPVNPLSSDTKTHWSSTYNLLKNLLLLRNAIIQLTDNLKQSVNRQERQDELKVLELLLSTEEWNSLDELAKLLHPFAQATGYIGENQYSTLEMMISTLIKLSHHLRDFYPTITSIIVRACCSKINESMLSRWFEPSLNSLIAFFLYPRFKKMSYITSIKKNETLTYLYTLYNNQEQSTSIQETELLNTNSSFFTSFYDDDNNVLVENENLSSVVEEKIA